MSRGAPQHLEMFVDGRFEFPVAIICSGFFSFGAINRFFWKKIPYVAIFYCLGWLVGWLWFGTTFSDVCHAKKNKSTPWPKYWKCRHHDQDTSRYQEIQFQYRSARKCPINHKERRSGQSVYFSRTWFSCSHMVVKIQLLTVPGNVAAKVAAC